MPHTRSNNGFWLSLAIAGTLTGLSVLGATTASAACPPGKETTDGQKPGATAHKGVDEKLLGQIDLGKEKVNLPGRLLRMRRLVIEPGGELRPAQPRGPPGADLRDFRYHYRILEPLLRADRARHR